MKKLLSLLMVLMIVFSVTACNNKPTENQPQEHKNNNINLQTKEPVGNWEEDGVLKILAIGNSFSNNTMQYVYEIASACGAKDIYLGNLYIGGCTLDTHAQNARNNAPAYTYYTNDNGVWVTNNDYKMLDAITSQNWDFISLQQASVYSGKPESYGELDYLINYVNENANKNAKLFWNMTWAYDNGFKNLVHYENDEKKSRQIYMFEQICKTVQQKIEPRSEFSAIIPSGTAIQNARTSMLGTKFTADGMHLGTLGQYIAGLTLVYNLTGLPIENIEYKAGLTDDEVKVAIESVLNASDKPFEVTESKFKED